MVVVVVYYVLFFVVFFFFFFFYYYIYYFMMLLLFYLLMGMEKELLAKSLNAFSHAFDMNCDTQIRRPGCNGW